MPQPAADTAESLVLVSVAGPRAIVQNLIPPKPVRAGRRSSNELMLGESDRVSREHARFVHVEDGEHVAWHVTDLGSRHGTRLNGVKLKAREPYPLQHNDLLEIAPWVFQVIDPAAKSDSAEPAHTLDETIAPDTRVRTIESTSGEGTMHQRLELLLGCAESIHSAHDETSLAECVLDAAITGTGFPNAVLLAPAGGKERYRVLGSRGRGVVGPSGLRISQTLIRHAERGDSVRMNLPAATTDAVGATSMVELGIEEALCVPIKLGTSVVGYLYLDSRRAASGNSGGKPAADAGEFALGVAHLAAMALSNIKRHDLERRIDQQHREMEAVAEAQRLMLPEPACVVGPLSCYTRNEPGRIVTGDFLELVSLDDHRLAVALGDVAGKGITAVVLMTTAKGFLYSAFKEHSDPARALTELNNYLCPRTTGRTFLSVWAGVFDTRCGTLTYADGGHGYALGWRDGKVNTLDKEGGPISGVTPGVEYTSHTEAFGPGDSVLVVSDGVVEQPAPPRDDASDFDRYGTARLQEVMAELITHESPIERLFKHVHEFAGDLPLQDDTTGIMVRWNAEA